ncbi:MAG TPA: PDDEXK nuclease domain-containing protein [Verrucomicrobiae bacterium]
MKRTRPKNKRPAPVYQRIRQILESVRSGLARSVNTTLVVANWLVGREIVEEEQRGSQRAEYGARLLEELSQRLKQDFGEGYSVQNLRYMRQFYLEFPALVRALPIHQTLRGELPDFSGAASVNEIRHTPCGELGESLQEWKPGQLHPNLSWSLYRHLLRVEKPEARSFYQIEAIQNNWSARQLERQINSLLYERLALSRDKKGLLRLARKGQEIQGPLDVFKDPLVLEFLKIPATARMVESDLETALLNELQAFLLELGKGFAFVSRQERISLDGDHFYIDLVFYHTILKCFILLDLKVGKLTHQDLGQLELYVNYYDRERVSPGDNPSLGLILCTDKNDAVVRYTLGEDQQLKIFASRYKLHLPSEAELKAELLRELKRISPAAAKRKTL